MWYEKSQPSRARSWPLRARRHLATRLDRQWCPLRQQRLFRDPCRRKENGDAVRRGTRAPFSASPMITSTSMPAMRMLMWGTRIRRRQTTVQFAGGQRPCIQGLSETEHRSASGNPDLLEIASSWFRSYRATSLHSALPVRRCITRTRSPENQRRAEPFTYRDLQQQQPSHGAA